MTFMISWKRMGTYFAYTGREVVHNRFHTLTWIRDVRHIYEFEEEQVQDESEGNGSVLGISLTWPIHRCLRI